MTGPRPHIRRLTLLLVALACFAAVLACVWAAPRVSEAVAAWLRAPPVRAHTVSLERLRAVPALPAESPRSQPSSHAIPRLGTGHGGPPEAVATGAVTLDPGMRFTMVGVTCDAVPAAGRLVWLRVSDDGRAWSAWYSAELERGGDRGRAMRRSFTEPVWTGSGRLVQIAAETSGRNSTALRDVKVVALNSDGDATPADVVAGVVRRVAAVVAGVKLTPAALAMTTTPDIVTRAQWGANESLRSGTPDYATVRMAFVHHTDGSNSYTRGEAAGIVRGIYYYHTKSLGWSDIGYNFLIDRYGTIYEGRYGGITKGPIGAQVLGFNTGSTGVSIMGNFTSATPPAAAVTALEELLAWKLDVHHVDPQGTAVLTCGYGQKFATGQQVKFPAIAGHRQANYTSCPGDRLYGMLPEVRAAVAQIGLPKIYGFATSLEDVSPNGDGVQDKTTLSFTVSEPASWKLEITDPAGSPVRTFEGTGTDAAVVWAGKDDAGEALPDGVYKAVASASSATGSARAAVAYVRLDTVPPEVRDVDVSPDPFSPNGDGSDDTAALHYTPDEASRSQVTVLDADGSAVRTLTGWRAVGASAQSIAWDGRVSDGGVLKAGVDGRYRLQVALKDVAGNMASVTRAVVADRTIGFATAAPAIFSPNADGVKDLVALGFTLTRQAEVTLAIAIEGATVRTVRLGKLGAGARSATWDGKLADGSIAASGRYQVTATAQSSVGTTSVPRAFGVDRYRPRLAAPLTARVAFGKRARITCIARDAYSPKVKVWGVVTDRAGTTVKSVSLGWVDQGKSVVWAWKPPSRKRYTVTFHAVDAGGNPQNALVQTSLRVR